MLGLLRNVVAIAQSPDLPRRRLATSYASLRARRSFRRRPRVAHLLDFEVAYADFGELVELFEEIFVRRHYPFQPRRQRPLMVDGGANIGVATLFFKAVAPDARILAFEPEPFAYRLLEQNVLRNRLAEVQCLPVALGTQHGEVALYAPTPGAGGSTLRPPDGDWPTTVVQAARLSEYLPDDRVDFLKLDVEGSEGAIIDELSETGTLERVDELAFEYHPAPPNELARILGILADAGFEYRIAVVGDRLWEPHQLLLVHAFRVPQRVPSAGSQVAGTPRRR